MQRSVALRPQQHPPRGPGGVEPPRTALAWRRGRHATAVVLSCAWLGPATRAARGRKDGEARCEQRSSWKMLGKENGRHEIQ